MTAIRQINMAQKRGKSSKVLPGEDWVSLENMTESCLVNEPAP